MEILIFKDGEVQLARKEMELIPEFAPLLTLNYNKQAGDLEGRKRNRAFSEFTYIWFRHAHASPYREYNEAERHLESLATAKLPADYRKSSEMLAAEKWYDDYINRKSRRFRLVSSAHRAVDKLQEYLDNVDFTRETQNGLLVNKPSDVMKIIGDLAKLAESLDELEARLKSERQEFASTRGAQEPGWLMEKEKFKDKTDGGNRRSGNRDQEAEET